MTQQEKEARYRQAGARIRALLDGEQDPIVKMASVCSVLAVEFPYYYWTGFYRLLDGELVIGPYQGTPGCLRIAIDRGVCGAAVRAGETLVVEDVNAFPGHIACDALSRSEIVVPVWDSDGDLLAVLDVDSDQVAAFDDADRVGLESILAEVFSELSSACQQGN